MNEINAAPSLNTVMTSSEKFAVENEVNVFNKQLNAGKRQSSQELGKDAYGAASKSGSDESDGRYAVHCADGAVFIS